MDVELGLMMSIKHFWVILSGSWVNTSALSRAVSHQPVRTVPRSRLTSVFWFLSEHYQPGGPIHLSPGPHPFHPHHRDLQHQQLEPPTRIISLIAFSSLSASRWVFVVSIRVFSKAHNYNKKLSNIGLISENQNQCRSQTETLQKMHSIDIKTESILTGLFLSCRNESWPADYTMWNSNASPSHASLSAFHLYLKYFLFVNIQHLPSSCHNATIHSMNALKEEMGGSPSQFWTRKKSKYLLWPRYDRVP